MAYNYHLGNFLSATASYSIYNRSYSNFGLGVSINLGPVEIYCLTDNILAFGTLNPRENFISNNSSTSINIDAKKVRNGQIHFGLNLTFGREKKEKSVNDGDNKIVKSSSSESNDNVKESSPKVKKSSKNVSSSKPNTSKKSNYNSKPAKKKKRKKKMKAKKVEQSAPKSSTLRKVSRQL